MGIGPELAGGMAGSALGSMMGGGGGGGDNKLMDQYNFLLNGALQNAINTSTNYTNQAKDQLNSGLGNATNAFNTGLTNASNQLIPYTNAAFGMGQALLSPYRNAGYAANNALLQSLGLPTQDLNAANQQYLGQQASLFRQQLTGNSNVDITAPTGPAPTLDNYLNQVTPQQIQDYIKQNTKATQLQNGNVVSNGGFSGQAYSGAGYNNGTPYTAYNDNGGLNQILNDPTVTNQAKQYLAQQAFNTANQQYQTQQNNYNQYQNFLQQSGYNPNASTNVNSGTATNPANPQGALQSFLNSPQYQLMFGNNAAQQYAQNGSFNPQQAFQQDPGTQFAIQQGLKDLQQQGAAKGLLESGPMQQNLLKYAQGMEDQQYQRFLQNQNSVFQNYQGQLAQMSNLGSGLTGANTAASLYSNLGNQLGQYNYGTGNNIAGANLSTSNDIASLLANQGVLNANAYLSTGAAQAQGLMANAGMNAQINAMNQANQGYMNAGSLFGGSNSGYNSTPTVGTYYGGGGMGPGQFFARPTF